jgi:hypothetical protein
LRAERHPAPHPPDRPEHGGQQAVRPETPDEIPVQSALLACGLIYFFFVRCLPRFAPYCLQDRRSLRPGAAALAGREAKPLPLPYNPLINVFEIDL